ncbi:MAG TPA: hypothetical protein VG295_03250 [Solirubrobacteraceae bacterium]|nr:hypothetical protein [Solirubrobacteraceae bacterium]
MEPALEAVAVRDRNGATLAGDPSLPASAEGLLMASGAGHVVIARPRPGAFTALVGHDLEAVARELG